MSKCLTSAPEDIVDLKPLHMSIERAAVQSPLRQGTVDERMRGHRIWLTRAKHIPY